MKIFRGTLLGSQAARQSFAILFVGLILIVSAALSIFGEYLLYGRHPISVSRLVDSTNKTISIVRALPIAELPHAVRLLSHQRGLYVSMTTQPVANAQILQFTDPNIIKSYIEAHSYNFQISAQLANGQWLNVQGRRPRSFWISLGALISGVTLLFGLIFLCVWAIQRLAWPWDAFTKAARRFGVDVEAPPLAVAGSREMQVVIKAFNEMQSRIRRLLHDRTQMLAAISHDLRTPITRLQLRAEYLEGTDQYEKAITDLNEMEKMIASILAFARDDAGKEPMERFDLNALLAALCDDMKDVGKPVVYRAKNLKSLPYFGRISALKRACSNIIENAVKYGKKAQIILRSVEGGAVQIIVEDEGPGVPEHQMENVFAPFFRLDASRSLSQSGTGLGMAVARDIVRAHGGDVKLYNLSPKGLRVLIALPMRTG